MALHSFRSRWLSCVLSTFGLALVPVRGAATQKFYAAAGGGPTPVLEGRSGSGNVVGILGYQGPRNVGFRLSGTETVSRLWLSADLTYQPGQGALRPYGLLGLGVAAEFGESDLQFIAGAGSERSYSA